MSAPDGSNADPQRSPPKIEDFLGEPTRDLLAWHWLFTHDVPFPSTRGSGPSARLGAWIKRLLRPLVRFATADLWERQRVHNLIQIELVEKIREQQAAIFASHQHYLERLHAIDERTSIGLQDVMLHNDALFARVDQKLDRYRREARELWHRLGALITTLESEPQRSPARVLEEQGYVALEQRFRGSEGEIADRLAVYQPYLPQKGRLLDLGCGRGEALAVFAGHGFEVHGIDASGEMVARCREKGLSAEQGDLFEALDRLESARFDAVVSFHVIEHLPPRALERLVRGAWRVLRPGGVLILETPSPLALAMSARNFWMDPTHLRPVHPASLEVVYREAGFEPVHRLDLHPFPQNEHLPEIDLERLPPDQQALADQVNRLRDLLDDLLFGSRDFALIGVRP